MKKIIISLVALLLVMEAVGWFAYKNSKKEKEVAAAQPAAEESPVQKIAPLQVSSEREDVAAQQLKKDLNVSKPISSDVISSGDVASFPPPSVEMVDGVAQRTIHMGVRQWEWDPSQLSVKFGEKVILIMHNADVPHSISIPELNVNSPISEEGAVVIFMANKRGTFDFSCEVPCGSGHSKMKGRITVA